MKRLVVIVIAVALLVVPVAFARGPLDPKFAPVAADVAKAKLLELQKASLGQGFTEQSTTKSSNSSWSCKGYAPNLSSLIETADVNGHEFSDNALLAYFSSSASVFASAADANKAFAVIKNARFGGCMREIASSSLKSSLAAHVLSVTPLNLQIGVLQMTGWDVGLSFAVKGKATPFEIAVFAYKHGRAISFLFASGISNAKLEAISKAASMAMSIAMLKSGF